jgi:predicted RNA-binding Zn-ribbon protein involved in translation (DUF1610 family)
MVGMRQTEKGKKEWEAIQNILSYIELTMKEENLDRKDALKHFHECPFCGTDIIKCPHCNADVPFRYKCLNCGRVLPLETLIEGLAKKTVEKKLGKP